MSPSSLSHLLKSVREIKIMIPFKPGSDSGGRHGKAPVPKPTYSSASEADDEKDGQVIHQYSDFEVEEMPDEPDPAQQSQKNDEAQSPTTKASDGPDDNAEQQPQIAQGHVHGHVEKEISTSSSSTKKAVPSPQLSKNKNKSTPKDSPSYVAPIGKIPAMPPIKRIHVPSDADDPENRPSVADIDKSHLVGKMIDEFGDIVDVQTGKMLGRVAGDLPSMVGRSISNKKGDVLGDDGELLGYVSEVEIDHTGKGGAGSATMGMTDFMDAPKGPGGLRVDQLGNILDPEGNIVGSFHDKISGFGKPAPPTKTDSSISGEDNEYNRQRNQKADTSSESRENAQSHRKESPGESPSDIFLDVKSTHEGIQLTIRIPTVFPNGGSVGQPQVVFS